MKKYKVFIGFCEVAGYYTNLIKGFTKLGIPTTPVFLNEDKYGYLDGKIKSTFFAKNIVKLSKKYYSIKRINLLPKLFFYFLLFSLKLTLFVRTIVSHNVFIFSFGQSFFNLKDLYVLKLLKKKIIFIYHGSDCRPPYLNGAYWEIYADEIEKILDLTYKVKKSVNIIEKFADYIINLPSQGQFFQQKFINWLSIGIPIYIESPNDKNLNEKLKILHAPTRTKQKGSEIFRSEIRNIISKGFRINFIEITDKKNIDVIKELNGADIVLDELYSDTPMAGFGTEAAFFGKPAVVCGLYAEYFREDTSEEYIPPSLFCKPEKMPEVLMNLIEDEKWRKKIGQDAKTFVRRKWNPVEVAKRFISLLDGDFPADWYYHPQKLKYFGGWGMNEEELRRNLSLLINKYGEEILLLSHNDSLLKRLLRFISVNV